MGFCIKQQSVAASPTPHGPGLPATPKTHGRRFSCQPENAYRVSRVKDPGLRFYSANLSRWINRDPIGERGGRNLFRFVRNNPVRLVDRNGRDIFGDLGFGSELGFVSSALSSYFESALDYGTGFVSGKANDVVAWWKKKKFEDVYDWLSKNPHAKYYEKSLQGTSLSAKNFEEPGWSKIELEKPPQDWNDVANKAWYTAGISAVGPINFSAYPTGDGAIALGDGKAALVTVGESKSQAGNLAAAVGTAFNVAKQAIDTSAFYDQFDTEATFKYRKKPCPVWHLTTLYNATDENQTERLESYAKPLLRDWLEKVLGESMADLSALQ